MEFVGSRFSNFKILFMVFCRVIVSIIILTSLSSCAFFFNEKEVELAINSSPSGAKVLIDGVDKGVTPLQIKLEPKEYQLSFVKDGYVTSSIKTQWWQTIRRGGGERARCFADALGTLLIVPAFSYASSYCRDFKQTEYSIILLPDSLSNTKDDSEGPQSIEDIVNSYDQQMKK